MKGLVFGRLEGKRTLMVGDVGSGKTRAMASLLRSAVASRPPAEVTVFDFAPDETVLCGKIVGGKVSGGTAMAAGLNYLSPRLEPPRLSGRDAEEVLSIARRNASLTAGCIEEYLSRPTPVLFANDLTMHLHAGDLRVLVSAVERSKTFIGNAYAGESLKEDRGSGISTRERDLLGELKRWMDDVIVLGE
ncbi:MAG: hypothetical protein JRN39_00880 [Nitrososphaerota archaeon]|nr:hypothetical protein [Nitrososphaerota archaeon]MDG6938948.1 hypothetical protein [Nitrososphaerota archaeon]